MYTRSGGGHRPRRQAEPPARLPARRPGDTRAGASAGSCASPSRIWCCSGRPRGWSPGASLPAGCTPPSSWCASGWPRACRLIGCRSRPRAARWWSRTASSAGSPGPGRWCSTSARRAASRSPGSCTSCAGRHRPPPPDPHRPRPQRRRALRTRLCPGRGGRNRRRDGGVPAGHRARQPARRRPRQPRPPAARGRASRSRRWPTTGRRWRRAPEDATAAFNLGVALEDLDRRAEAIEAYQRAISRRPGHRRRPLQPGAPVRADGPVGVGHPPPADLPPAHQEAAVAAATAGRDSGQLGFEGDGGVEQAGDGAAALGLLGGLQEGLGLAARHLGHHVQVDAGDGEADVQLLEV